MCARKWVAAAIGLLDQVVLIAALARATHTDEVAAGAGVLCPVASLLKVAMAPKMCEGCGTKHANYGLLTERRRRWCAGCAAAEGGVLLRKQKKCEQGCGLKEASFGLPDGGKTVVRRRWCANCAKK